MCAYVQGIATPNSRSFSCKTRVREPKMYFFWKKNKPKITKFCILLNSTPKFLLNPCAHVSRAFPYQISGHLVVKPGYRGQKCTFCAKNDKKVTKFGILFYHMSNQLSTLVCTCPGHSYTKFQVIWLQYQGAGAKIYIFWSKNDPKKTIKSF